MPTIPLLERISAALDADLIVEIASPSPEPEPTDRPQLRTLVVSYARPTG